jgi:hypothetical protein
MEATLSNGVGPAVDLDALLVALTPEQRAQLAAKKSMAEWVPERVPVRIPATGTAWNFNTSKERAMGLEPTTSSLGRRRKNKG